MMKAQYQIYTKHNQYYPASNISARIFCNMQNISNLSGGPAQVDNFIRSDIGHFREAARSGIV